MKKNHEQKRQLRRLTLNRETILVLDDPALLELARGGLMQSNLASCGPATSASGDGMC